MSAAELASRPTTEIPYPFSRAELRATRAPTVLALRRRFATFNARISVIDDPEYTEPSVVVLLVNCGPPAARAATVEARRAWGTELTRRIVESTLVLAMRNVAPVRNERCLAALGAVNAVIAGGQLLMLGHSPAFNHRFGDERLILIDILVNSGRARPELDAARAAMRTKGEQLRAEGFTW